MANRFSIEPANPLQALMAGAGAYDSARKRTAADEQQAAFKDVGDQIAAGGAVTPASIGKIAGLGPAGAPLLTAIAGMGKADTTDEIKEYKLSQQQGFTGSFTDWKTGLKRAGATNVNTNVSTGDKAYDKTINEGYAKNFLEFQKGGRDANGALGTLDQMERLVSHPNFYSGTAEGLVTSARRAAAGLGVTASDKASPNELFGAMGNKLILDASGGSLGAGFSNADRDFIASTVPNLANTPEGNKAIIGVQRQIYQRKQQVAQQARQYASKHGMLDDGFDQVLADWAEKNPMFKQAAPAQQAAPAARPAGQQTAPVQVQSPEDARRLAPGTPFITPDGRQFTR